MKIPELVERLGRTVFEAPFGATAEAMSDSPEVAEIRIAVLDEVKKKIQRAGGKALFPFNVVRIRIRAAAEMAPVFERDFFRQYFGEEVRAALKKEACRCPDDLRVEIRVVDMDGPLVETVSEDVAPAVEPAPVKRIARLSVIAGVANKPEIPLKARTNIGRLGDVYKAEGVSRRNDLVFAADDPINRTVSREHAHIMQDKKTGEYRLFNDRWYKRGDKNGGHCGLWIVRDGLGQEVHRDARGTRLLPGDEIHLGKAIVKFQMK